MSAPDSELVTLDNAHVLTRFFADTAFVTKLGPTVMFTNANEWYVDTLVANLMASYQAWNQRTDRQIGLVCTDTQALTRALKHGWPCCLLESKDLGLETLFNTSQPASYRRLCFAKTAIAYHALMLDYAVIYIDPDMSFNLGLQGLARPVDYIDYLIDGHGLQPFRFDDPTDCFSGVRDMEGYTTYESAVCGAMAWNHGRPKCHINLNTNLMVLKPTPFTRTLFRLTKADLAHFTSQEGMTDETFIDRVGRPDQLKFLSNEIYPGGRDTIAHKHRAHTFHANCVKGLENKIALLKECGGWYLPESGMA
jgi:hypothetical protein